LCWFFCFDREWVGCGGGVWVGGSLNKYKFILVSRMLTLRDLTLSNVHTVGFKMDFMFLTSV